jgi:anti-anti-sigma factor
MREEARTPLGGDASFQARVSEATAEVVVAGDLDMAAAFRFESELESILDARAVRSIVLDLAQVGFVDSAGLGALLSIRDRASRQGIELKIVRVSDAVRRILDVTGIGDIAVGDEP